MKLRASLLAVVLVTAARLGAAEPGCTTCHEKLLKGKALHAPAESCDACHESVATPHPQKGKKTFKLAQQGAALCASCHEVGKKARVHAPVSDGSCTTCHDPHSSAEAKLLTAPMKELCGTCHGDKVESKLPHGPVSAGDCTACHAPHEGESKGLLVKPGDALCFGCHADMQDAMKKKVVHAAAESGCTSCHDPHGSAHRKLLSEEGAGLCFGCHAEVGEKVKQKVVHAPVRSEKGCASCHSPHAADVAKLLSLPGKELCLSCHKTILTKAMTVLHGPIAKGGCTPCHDPHGSPSPKLLAKGFPAEPYVPYTESAFALCFGCHKVEAFEHAETSFATKFRDGERNLHYLHVNNKRKGRSCRLCHDVHGADNASLVAEKVPFGTWKLPLKFVKSENGGSCAPGCHKPFVYNRKTPGKKDEPPAAAPKPEPKAKPK